MFGKIKEAVSGKGEDYIFNQAFKRFDHDGSGYM